MDERINILIGSDINYAPYYGVMLTSLFMNNKESKFDVYLLTDETWTDAETKKFSNLANSFNSTFKVIVVDFDIVKDFPKTFHISLPTYYRLQACNLLPNNIHKILYLDGDMIVSGDIRPLWDITMDGLAVAGVPDCASWSDEYFDRIKIDRKWGYINAGVSLYNLDYWREHNVSNILVQHIIEHPDMVPLMDQDAVNNKLKDKKTILPKKYNLQTWAFLKENWNHYDEQAQKEYLDAAKEPVIIHYSGWYKPWQIRSYYGMPFFNLWIKYWKLSGWKNAVKYKPIIKYIKFVIKYVTHFRLYDNRNKLFIKESYEFA